MFPIQDTKTKGRFPFWVALIVSINVFVFFLEITSENLEGFISQYALIPELINFPHLETLIPFITSQFLHGGFIHIISNMWFLKIFGDNVEEKLGFFFFPIVYLLSGALGGFLQYFFMPQSSIPMLGASGGVAGVLGAYFVFFPHHKIKTLIPVFGLPAIIEIPASFMLIYWFFTQAFSGVASITVDVASGGGVAFMAHVGGFTFGWLIAKIFR